MTGTQKAIRSDKEKVKKSKIKVRSDANGELTDKQGGAYLPFCINIEVCYIYKTRNELVHGVLRLSFPVYNSLIGR